VRNSLLVNYVVWRRKYNGAQDKHRNDELWEYLYSCSGRGAFYMRWSSSRERGWSV